MSIDLLNFIERYFPWTKKGFARGLYNFLAWRFPYREWQFMNYGYDDEEMDLALDPEDEPNRYFIQMYAATLGSLEVRDRDILEVGCGRGGGSEWIARAQKPRSMTGLDLSENAISLCRERYELPNLKYVRGDAQQLPFADNSFDIVLNIESSHHYPSMVKFLHEVCRVLKPGGYFCIADYRERTELDGLKKALDRASLNLIQCEDITTNVVRALKLTEAIKIDFMKRYVPWFLSSLVRTFAAAEGSEIYNRFVEDRLPYIQATLRKVTIDG